MMMTGHYVQELALYSSECCKEELIFVEGDRFSPCPRCSRNCSWTEEEKLVSYRELERLTERLEAA